MQKSEAWTKEKLATVGEAVYDSLEHEELVNDDEAGERLPLICPGAFRRLAFDNISTKEARRLEELHDSGPVTEMERALRTKTCRSLPDPGEVGGDAQLSYLRARCPSISTASWVFGEGAPTTRDAMNMDRISPP